MLLFLLCLGGIMNYQLRKKKHFQKNVNKHRNAANTHLVTITLLQELLSHEDQKLRGLISSHGIEILLLS